MTTGEPEQRLQVLFGDLMSQLFIQYVQQIHTFTEALLHRTDRNIWPWPEGEDYWLLLCVILHANAICG